VPGGPAERAGLRAARALPDARVGRRQSPACSIIAGRNVAAKVLQASGGVDHGDLILALAVSE